MKKLTMICMSALLMLAVSCKKDKNDEIENPGSGFRATVESHEGDSKTHLDGLAVKWDSGDEILVKSSTCSTPKSFITTGTGASANFEATESLPTDFYTPNYTAYYPADLFKGNENVIELSGWPSYVENTFAKGANPMVATSSDNVLHFKNICGVLELQLYSEEECYVGEIDITSDAGEQLCGFGTVTLTDGIPSLSMDPDYDYDEYDPSTLSLYPDDAVALSTDPSAPTAFYFVVPAGTLGKSFTVTVYDGEWENVWSKTANSTQNLIGRSQITVMPPLPVEMHVYKDVRVTTIPGCFNCAFTFSGKVTIVGTGKCEYGFVYAKTADDAYPTIGSTGCNTLPVNTETISDDKDFTADIPDLEESTDYSYRAYCICDGEYYYGDPLVYSTPKPLPSNWVNNKSPYPFTVGMDGGTPRKVYFSQGNLQYNASGSSSSAVSGANVGGTWRFAEHQFDFVGDDAVGNVYEGGVKSNNANIAQAYGGWIDLFGWGTSGYNHGATCYQPWSTDFDYSHYYAYGSGNNNLYGKADWGYNAISNGGNMENSGWRTLTSDEWYYLIDEGRLNADKLYGQGKVGSCIPGLIILPDDWSWTGDVAPFETSWVPGESDWKNVYNYSEWAKMEAAGAVFLPTAGGRTNLNGISVGNVGEAGFYWSSSYRENSTDEHPFQAAYDLFIYTNWVTPNRYNNNSRDYGFSVRLVRPAE